MKGDYKYLYHPKDGNPPAFGFTANVADDKDVVDFLKLQSKKTKMFRLAINILVLLFGKQDLIGVFNEVEKYGLINVLEKRLTDLKKDSDNYMNKS